jgi:protein-S-isoprenylcysteine O-methyltransferase Ste14
LTARDETSIAQGAAMSAESVTQGFDSTRRTHWIDPSAWISGGAFAAGVVMADPGKIIEEILVRGLGLYLIPGSYAVFLLAVLLIQRHMRKSMLASTFGRPQLLTTSGVFKYSRNPIYVAFFLPLASLAAISLAASLAAIGLYVLAMNIFVIRKEERDLSLAFRGAFLDYMAKTPRWLI